VVLVFTQPLGAQFLHLFAEDLELVLEILVLLFGQIRLSAAAQTASRDEGRAAYSATSTALLLV
jgi:hypothetical protein